MSESYVQTKYRLSLHIPTRPLQDQQYICRWTTGWIKRNLGYVINKLCYQKLDNIIRIKYWSSQIYRRGNLISFLYYIDVNSIVKIPEAVAEVIGTFKNLSYYLKTKGKKKMNNLSNITSGQRFSWSYLK